jgi:transaldolase
MKFFIDTANLEEIKEAKSLGILDGVTTNPTLIAKENKPFKEVILAIAREVEGPVSVEVISTDYEGMVKEARLLASLAKNFVIKIPMTKDGIKATKTLSSEGIKVNVTLVFSVNQGLLAAKAGAYFISPFVGRLDDIGEDGMEVVSVLKEILEYYNFSSQVLASSIRHPKHIIEAALAGADIVTVPFKVLELLFKHPLTDIGLERFLKDWQAVPDKSFI